MKKFIGIIATMISVVAFSIVSYAAGWNLTATDWEYLDANGDRVVDTWKPSGNYWFYLDSNGDMARESLIETGDNYYYVDIQGVMIKDLWKYISKEEDGESHWMYFSSTGKAYKDGWHTINGKDYHFTDSMMDYGYLDADGNMLDEDFNDSDIWEAATYYCGDETDGSKYIGWQKVVGNESYSDDFVWIYFNTNGKKVANETKVINSYRYNFDNNGAMVTDFYYSTATSSYATDSSATKYYNDGALVKNGWIYATAEGEDSESWYYADSKGELVKDTIKKINGKKFAFDSDGKLITGFVTVIDNVPVSDGIAAEDITVAELKAMAPYMYFDENSGAATSKITIELDDDAATIYFNSDGTVNMNTIIKNYLYENGVIVAHDRDNDERNYGVYEVYGHNYLVNTSGKNITKNVTDRDGYKWEVTETEITLLKKDSDTKLYNVEQTWSR